MKLTSLVYLDAAVLATAQQLAARFDLPCVDGTAVAGGKPKWLQRFVADLNPDVAEAFVFVLGVDGLALYAAGPQYGVSIRADFHGPSVTFRRARRDAPGVTRSSGSAPLGHVVDVRPASGRNGNGCQPA